MILRVLIKGIEMYRSVSIVILSLILSGCVGLAVGTYGKTERARTDFRLIKERNQFHFSKTYEWYTEEDIIEHWGEPEAVDNLKECKVLIYKDGISWAGVGAFLGIAPVPLLIPTGTYKNRFYLKNGLAIGLVQEYGEIGRYVGYTCGSNECSTSTGEKTNYNKRDSEEAIERWCTKYDVFADN